MDNLDERVAAAVQAERDGVDVSVNIARIHAVAVAAVALYGEAKIDEPLTHCAVRTEEKLTKKFAPVVGRVVES